MENVQRGILSGSEILFFSPTQSARSLFYYPTSAGYFICDSRYSVQRESFDSLLVFHVIKGSFSFLCDGREKTAHAGETAVVDCFHPHAYYTIDGFEARWVHINGLHMIELYRELTERYGGVLPVAWRLPVEKAVRDIYTSIQNHIRLGDAGMSLLIYQLIAALFGGEASAGDGNSQVSMAAAYILENYSERLTVASVAQKVHMSASHFSRTFKKQMGASPYDYILHTRLAKAKELLKKTNLSVQEIAYQTGFASASNFIDCFKSKENISPLKFRNLTF